MSAHDASGNQSPGAADANLPANSPMSAFARVCDVKTNRLLQPVCSPAGRKALAELNNCTAHHVNAMADAVTFTVTMTLSQGACLLAGVFEQVELLTGSWCGPECKLSKRSLTVLRPFKGTKTWQVRRLETGPCWRTYVI